MKGLLLEIKDYRIYLRMIRASIQARMEYRGSFFMYIFTVLGFYGAQIAVIGVMLARFKKIGGWSTADIAFLYSLLVMSQGIASMTCSGLMEFSQFIRDGSFDRLLLRPLSTLMQMLTMRFEPAGVAHFILGIAAFFAAQALSPIDWGPVTVLMYVGAVLGGSAILASVRIMVAAAAFFTVTNAGLQHLAVFSAREFLLYPVDIYSRPIRFILTFFFPLAFINFYPAHYFLNKDSSALFHPAFIYLTLPIGILMLALAGFSWAFAVRHYSSTGN